MAPPPAPNRFEIVLATGNPHKVEEMRAVFAALGLSVPLIGLADLPGYPFPEPRERGVGATFEQNATIKALGYAETTGRWCLADDSGLEVDALQGRPGVISSHYCTDGREVGTSRAERDAANNERVLRELAGVPPAARSARFVCVMALARPVAAQGGQDARPPVGQPGGQDARPPSPGSPSKWGAGILPAPTTFSGKQHWSFSGDLPHFQVGGATYFVTFRCIKPPLTPAERQIVCDALLFWHDKRMMLHAATVMPDHVHVLFRPIRQSNGEWPTLDGLLHSIKSFSAKKIAEVRGAAGSIWQSEYFDRVMRDAEEMEEAYRYIQENPVKAGLAASVGAYPFTVYGASRAELNRAAASPPGGQDARPPSALPPGGQDARPPLSAEVLARARGTFEGRIGVPPEVPKGHNGFGYDPLFLVGPAFDRTSAELSAAEKNARSHRGAAAARMARQIAELVSRPPVEKDPAW